MAIKKEVKRLLIIRGLRSLWQGMMVVDLALYLAALNWSGVTIGIVLTASSLFGAVLILLVGMLSDRIGRKPFLLISESLTLLSGIGACLTTNFYFLAIAIIFANFGRGQTGAAGPFAPAEHAWLAQLVTFKHRGKIFSYNTAIGFLGMGAGALIGGLPTFLQPEFSVFMAYRPIFFVIVLISVINLCLLATLKEPKRQSMPKVNRNAQKQVNDKKDPVFKRENRRLVKLAIVNTINGMAIGLIGPLMSYWFAVKFGVGTAAVGVTISISFFLTFFSSMIMGGLTEKWGIIKSVVWLRLVGFVLLILLPFAPFYWLASLLYILRNAVNRGTQGARQAISASLTRDERRGLSASVGAFSMRLPASAGPSISGTLIQAGYLASPFLFASGLQLVYLVLYYRFFKEFDGPSKGVATGGTAEKHA